MATADEQIPKLIVLLGDFVEHLFLVREPNEDDPANVKDAPDFGYRCGASHPLLPSMIFQALQDDQPG